MCVKLMCVQLMPEQEHLLFLVACVHEKLMTLKPSLPVVLFPFIYRMKEIPRPDFFFIVFYCLTLHGTQNACYKMTHAATILH
jgi:hypothetical protein